MLPNCPQTIIAYYATLSLGAIAVMTNPLYVERELEYQWGDSGAKAVISLDIFWPRIEAVRQKLLFEHVILSGIQDYMPLAKKLLAPLELRRQGKWVSVPYNDTVHPLKKLIGRQRPSPPRLTTS
jgi:long-chain acyl-CoA synthetase